MSKYVWCNNACSFKGHTSETITIPLVSHNFVSLANILITARWYLSGVKRKTSAPSIICTIFIPVGQGAGLLPGRSLKPGATFPENTAGIWLRGRWVSFQQGEGGMCSLSEGECYVLKGGQDCIWAGAKLSITLGSWEMYVWCKHVGSWWKHES